MEAHYSSMNNSSNSMPADVPPTSMDDATHENDYPRYARNHNTRSDAGSTSRGGTTITTSNGAKRNKDIPPCFVCGAEAYGYNFDQVTCESCKAFFRRNALKSMDKFRCRNNEKCVINVATRKRCKRCRLLKCFQVKMRKDWILSDEEKTLKREKVERNRLLKQKAQMALQQQQQQEQTNIKTVIGSPSQILPPSLMSMYPPSDQALYERPQFLLEQLSSGYQSICQRFPQPQKFLYRNIVISEVQDFELKLLMVKDLTHDLTQMTTLRLLHFFNLIPEFQRLTQQEKTSLLTQNMLPVFMFHGALTYNPENDTFVDRTTADEPYDAKYLLYVYGPKVYHDFIALARALVAATYQTASDEQSREDSHKLFLLLMAILLFSQNFQINSFEGQNTTLKQLQRIYVDLTCRFLHDRFTFTVRQRMFQQLVPLLQDLQELCSALANVKLCEMAEDGDGSSSLRSTPTGSHYSNQQSTQSSSSTSSSSSEFNSTTSSGNSHSNESQKENRAPSSSASPLSISTARSSPSVLSSTAAAARNY